MNRKEILEKAIHTVCGDREEDYGSPERNLDTIAQLWSAYLGVNRTILADDVAAMMALVKIARIAGGQVKMDNWVDLAGYAACGGEIQAQYPQINADLTPLCPECGAECETYYVDLWEDHVIGCEHCIAKEDAVSYALGDEDERS